MAREATLDVYRVVHGTPVVVNKELQFMNWELQLTRPVRTHRSDLPGIIRTLGDAVEMIDEHLPETLRIRPVWQQVKDMLVTAAQTRTALSKPRPLCLNAHWK